MQNFIQTFNTYATNTVKNTNEFSREENIVIDFKKYDKGSQFKLPIVLEDKKTNEYYLKNNGYICK